ncbi:pyrroloquinoline quinone biosynthesis protein C, partial [Neptuniibacter sp. 1_MG-2023]|nr:pyrroloquinoline quinone biosynthesis protein C [Neptuniibacter sp. 1_MG-2023]
MTSNASDKQPMSRDEFEAALRAKGDFYHTQHPYHIAMYDGKCTPEQIRG